MLPERLHGEHFCLATTRVDREGPAEYVGRDRLPPRDDARILEARTREGKPQGELIRLALAFGEHGVTCATKKLYELMEKDRDRSRTPSRIDSESYVVFRTSVGDWVQATSTEMAVDLDDTVTAIDATIEHFDAMAARGFFHISPIGVRFSRASAHYLAMQHGRETCTIEAPIPVGDVNVRSIGDPHAGDAAPIILTAIERRLLGQGLHGRPHWGQRHTVTGAFMARYPCFAKWKRVYERFNASRTFSSSLTERMGLG
jgi:hypothetical protein